MDGDSAPLAELAALCAREGAWLMVDDAHGIGIRGATGAGSVEAAGLGMEEVPVLMGTLGKALGSAGAFVAGDDTLVEGLIQGARNYIYTTAMPPAVACAALAAVRLLDEEAWRRDHLDRLVARFRAGAEAFDLPLLRSTGPIQPLLVGDAARAMALSDALRQRGLLVGAIRPPTVPRGTSRLRITLTAAHDEQQVDTLLQALRDARVQAP
jgi:8-amino-7-oxononanoate synthase